MAPPTKKPCKPIFKTSSPFTETKWPPVSHEDQETITELLCNLLSPLGEHRRGHVQLSKGKKRKRDTNSSTDDDLKPPPPPPSPAIGSHLLIGLNSVTRHLEALAASAAPPTALIKRPTIHEHNHGRSDDGDLQLPKGPLRSLSLVILTHPQPSISPAHAHIPILLRLATIRSTTESKSPEHTRLIVLPTSHDIRFANVLNIPRVGAIGVFEGAPGARSLEDYVRMHVGLVECAWVDEATKPEWRGLDVQQA